MSFHLLGGSRCIWVFLRNALPSLDKLERVNQFTAIMETIAFKTTDGDFIRQQAAARKITVSEFIRDAVEAMKPKQGYKIVKRNGRLLVVHPPGTPPITDADLDAADEEYYLSKAK